MTLLNLLAYGLKRFVKNEKGQAMVEYGLIIALVAVVLIVVLIALSGGLTEIFGDVEGKLRDPG